MNISSNLDFYCEELTFLHLNNSLATEVCSCKLESKSILNFLGSLFPYSAFTHHKEAYRVCKGGLHVPEGQSFAVHFERKLHRSFWKSEQGHRVRTNGIRNTTWITKMEEEEELRKEDHLKAIDTLEA